MESGSNSQIGILFDHPDYVEQLRKFSGLNLTSLPLSLIFSAHSKALHKFEYEGQVMDYLIIYSAIKREQRQNNYGFDWIKSFRLAGYNTPIILLTSLKSIPVFCG